MSLSSPHHLSDFLVTPKYGISHVLRDKDKMLSSASRGGATGNVANKTHHHTKVVMCKVPEPLSLISDVYIT